MNERVIVIVIFAIAAVMLFFYFLIAIVLLIVAGGLIAYWLYVDAEHRQEDFEYLSKRISEIEKYFDARKLSAIQARTDTWICPGCKTLNSNELKICQQCKRLKPT